MAIGVVGRKAGMTRVFTDAGETVPVTVIEVLPNRVTQVKSQDKDGYRAVQVTYGTRRPQLYSKAVAGHFAKANVAPGQAMVEFRLADGDKVDLQPGAEVKVDLFKAGEWVDVTGTTIGKGFAGVIKRHHFSSNRATHGNSISHNKPGSTGQNQSPGRVFPGKRMSGHLGDVQRTILNLEVVRIDAERQLLLVKGSVPGSNGRDVLVRPAVKIGRAAGPSGKKAEPKAEAKARPAAAAKPAAQQPAPKKG